MNASPGAHIQALHARAVEHSRMVEVLMWLAEELATLTSSPLPSERVAGPHGWSYRASGTRTYVALILKAPSAELIEMVSSLSPYRPGAPHHIFGDRPDEIILQVNRPD